MIASKSEASGLVPASGTPKSGTPTSGTAKSAKPKSSTPRPGDRVRGSHTGRPTMVLLDLLGRRWTLRVLWELRNDGAQTFRELQTRCGNVSSSVLNQRVRELRAAGIVAGRASEGESRAASGYQLTEAGHELLKALGPLDAWAANWPAADAPDRLMSNGRL